MKNIILLFFISYSLIINSCIQPSKSPPDSNSYILKIAEGDSESLKNISKIFKKNHPDIESGILFYAPNFVFGVGCKSKNEILNLQKRLKKEYPNSIIMECYSVVDQN